METEAMTVLIDPIDNIDVEKVKAWLQIKIHKSNPVSTY